MTETVKLEVQLACAAESLPEEAEMRGWLEAALAAAQRRDRLPYGIVVRVVDERESRELNRRYRQQDKPTNVLAFPAGDFPDPDRGLQAGRALGDLAICAPIVEREAREQGKSAAAHWGHLLVHGVLHLLGYDHHSDKEAARMERLEVRVLADRGFGDPYAAVETVRGDPH